MERLGELRDAFWKARPGHFVPVSDPLRGDVQAGAQAMPVARLRSHSRRATLPQDTIVLVGLSYILQGVFAAARTLPLKTWYPKTSKSLVIRPTGILSGWINSRMPSDGAAFGAEIVDYFDARRDSGYYSLASCDALFGWSRVRATFQFCTRMIL